MEHILHFLEDFAKNIIYQGVHMVYNAQVCIIFFFVYHGNCNLDPKENKLPGLSIFDCSRVIMFFRFEKGSQHLFYL